MLSLRQQPRETKRDFACAGEFQFDIIVDDDDTRKSPKDPFYRREASSLIAALISLIMTDRGAAKYGVERACRGCIGAEPALLARR